MNLPVLLSLHVSSISAKMVRFVTVPSESAAVMSMSTAFFFVKGALDFTKGAQDSSFSITVIRLTF